MAGVITDLIDRVSDSATGRPIIANLAAPGKAIAASSINLDAATNWTTSSAIHFSIYETTTVGSTVVKNSATQTDWKGTLSGVAIGNLTLTGGTDRAYTAGAKVEITPTARYAKDLYDWAMTGHNQNGTHKAFTESSIVPTAAIQDGAVTTVKITDANVTTAKVADSAITPVKMDGVDIYARSYNTITGTPPAAQSGKFYTTVGSVIVTTDAFGDGTATFSTAFPNGCMAVIANSGDAAAFNGSFTPNNFTATTFGVRSYPVSSGAKRVNYIAIGW